MIDRSRRSSKMNIFNVVFFLISLTVVLCKEYVPVLVWSTQTTADSYPVIPALTKLSSSEFSDYLLKRVKIENPLILVFVEENLSVEDFSWRDVNDNGAFPSLSNLTKLADDVAFLPSVHDPYKGLRKLRNHGYDWKYFEKDGFKTLKDQKNAIFEVKLDEPDFLEDRPDMLKRHDQQMAKIYREALEYKPNVMVVYTGNHTSWIDAELERFKREEKDVNSTAATASDRIVISDANNVVRISASLPIIFKNKDSNSEIKFDNVVGNGTISDNNKSLIMTVKFASNNNDVKAFNFKFESGINEWWTLNSVEIQTNSKPNLIPSEPIGAPYGHSYFCNPVVVFSNSNFSLTFTNFQVQPRVGAGNSFGPVLHCIPYFSIAIWSGLIIVFILSVVLAWGIVMIMDINTNDRFDDPKGKTITISAVD